MLSVSSRGEKPIQTDLEEVSEKLSVSPPFTELRQRFPSFRSKAAKSPALPTFQASVLPFLRGLLVNEKLQSLLLTASFNPTSFTYFLDFSVRIACDLCFDFLSYRFDSPGKCKKSRFFCRSWQCSAAKSRVLRSSLVDHRATVFVWGAREEKP